MVEQARRITAAIDIPLVCDIDTGYGNALNLRRTVQLMENAGVAGIQIEDQVFPKRCGHFSGKDIISQQEMVSKIRAACDARTNPDVVVIARTDARAVSGIDDAVERALAYANAGADVLFVEAPQTHSEIERIARELSPHPLLINIVEGGKTPIVPFDELAALGYRIILYPTAGIRTVMEALRSLYAELYVHNGTATMLDRLVTFDERNEITGLADYEALEQRYRVDTERHSVP
jgi:2-methylisocitrate lyase-like PEP mutase family enzyme